MLTLIALGIWGGLWVQSEYVGFTRESAALRESYLNEQKAMLMNQVGSVANYINYSSAQTENRLQQRLEQRVTEAHQIAWNIYLQNKKTASPASIQKMIKDALRPIRFNNNRGCYFAFNLSGIEELFADRPELEGTNMLNLPKAGKVVQDMLNLIAEKKGGFYEYLWSKPGRGGDNYRKISYIKLFEPYGWVLGSGDYIDDARLDLQNELLERLITLRFGEEGYFFGSTFQGDSLFSDGRITRDSGGNILGLTDPNGVKIIEEQLRKAKTSPFSGFVRYSWNKIDQDTPTPKLAYVVGLADWEWVIGAGVYLDEVEHIITANRAKLQEELFANALKYILFTLPLFLLILLFARHAARQIRKNSDAFAIFFKKAASGAVFIDEEKLYYTEFKNIALAANQMLQERNIAQKSFLESEKRYLSMFEDNYSIMLFIDSLSGNIIDANSAACAFYGYDREALLQMNISDINMLSQDEIEKEMQEAKQKKRQHFFFQHQLANGEIRDVEVYSSPLTGFKQPILFSVIHDISRRKRAEKELVMFKAYAETSKQGIGWADSNTNICYINPAMAAILGETDRSPVMGKNAVTTYYPVEEQRRLNEEILPHVLKNGSWSGEMRIRQKNGSLIATHNDFFLIGGMKSDELFFANIIIDVTERKKAEQEKVKLREQLHQAKKMESIGLMAGGVAHDLNNILAGIVGYPELILQNLPEDSELQKPIRAILESGQRAAVVVADLLTVARGVACVKENCNLNVLAKEYLDSPEYKKLQSLYTQVACLHDLTAIFSTILCSPVHVKKCLMNLVTNAAEAVFDAGTITVSTSNQDIDKESKQKIKAGKYVVLTVQDTGPGIAKKDIEHVFEPFYSKKIMGRSGTGLGLSVVWNTMEDHDGRVFVESDEQGTCFQLYFPVSTAVEKEKTQNKMEETEKPREHSGHILVVDDEAQLRDIADRMLQAMGYRVDSVSSGEEAVEFVRKQPVDLLLLDMLMEPGINGYQTYKEILRFSPSQKAVIASGFSESKEIDETLRLGANEFIKKPYSMDQLGRAVLRTLKN